VNPQRVLNVLEVVVVVIFYYQRPRLDHPSIAVHELARFGAGEIFEFGVLSPRNPSVTVGWVRD